MSTDKKPQRVYNQSDIASQLGVTQQMIYSWRKGDNNTPVPDFETPSGMLLWLTADDWIVWHEAFANAELVEARKHLARAERHVKEVQKRVQDAAHRRNIQRRNKA